jgi:multidrug efflux system outer membrane protein
MGLARPSHRRASGSVLLVLALPLLLAGCGLARWLTPDAPSSGMTLPRTLRNADEALAAHWPDALWWRGFGSPELDRLMADAMAANQTIASAEAVLRQADAQLRIAGASLLPILNLTGNATRVQTTVAAATSGVLQAARRTRKSSSNSIGLAGSYEIDFWGKNRATVEAAQQNQAAARFNLGAVTITISAAVANTYFAMLAAREQAAIQHSNLRMAEHVLDTLKARLAVGTATGLDVAQQETVVAQIRANLPPLLQSLEQNRNALATLTGRPPASLEIGDRGDLHGLSVPVPAPGLTAEILVRRPDLWQAEANLAAANANVVFARAQMLPSVTLTGSGGFQSLAIESLLQPGSAVFNIAAGLLQPIFRGGALIGQVQLNEAQAMELLAAYRQAILDALLDTEDGVVALREATQREILQAGAVRAAQRAYTIADAQLRAGTIDVITLLNVQQSLFTARQALALARLARLQAVVGLYRALGGGWDTPA